MGPVARHGSGARRLGEPTLTAADWAEAALQLVAEKGLEGLTVSALAARLGVTKGSFYWHFAGRDELLREALARWEERSTTAPIKGLAAVRDPRRRLELILDAASERPRARSLYAALAGASGHAVVGPALARVAAARIGYLETCYRELGLDRAAARARALLAYAAYRGLLQLAHEAPREIPADWAAYPPAARAALLPAAKGKAR
jgi:AcrR family transcriptional regulator